MKRDCAKIFRDKILNSEYNRELFEERFWMKVKISNRISCWEWTSNKNIQGYGTISVAGIVLAAPRASYLLHYGYNHPFFDIMQVCHSCDNPSCVNPYHLWLGTAKDNKNDCVVKGRHTVGEANNSKLKESDVIDIYYDNRNQYEIAKDYKIYPSVVSRIKSGKAWKHLQLAI